MSRKDVDLLDSYVRNKRTFCNLSADKHEITSYEIHGSHVFIDSICSQVTQAQAVSDEHLA